MRKIETETCFIPGKYMFQKVQLQNPLTKIKENNKGTTFSMDETFITISQKLLESLTEKFDKYLMGALFQRYKDMGITSILVIDEEQFKEFLLKYLPIWKKEKEKL